MKRPLGVTIIAVLAIIGAAIALFDGLAFLGVNSFGLALGSQGAFATLALGTGIALLVSAIVQLTFGIGALGLKPWAWTLGVVVFALTLLVELVVMLSMGIAAASVSTALVSAVVLGYLYTHDVREAFGHLPHSTSSGSPVAHA
jgi:hypothetical protein